MEARPLGPGLVDSVEGFIGKCGDWPGSRSRAQAGRRTDGAAWIVLDRCSIQTLLGVGSWRVRSRRKRAQPAGEDPGTPIGSKRIPAPPGAVEPVPHGPRVQRWRPDCDLPGSIHQCGIRSRTNGTSIQGAGVVAWSGGVLSPSMNSRFVSPSCSTPSRSGEWGASTRRSWRPSPGPWPPGPGRR